MNSTLWSVLILCAALSVVGSAQAQQGPGCVAAGPQIQVLGSGRPDLHAAPSTWGRIAREAGVGHLLLSHLSVNQDLDANLAHLRAAFSGTTTLAEDLMCISLPR